MKYSIRYLTEYRYDSLVFDQHNALRVRPAATANQRVDAFELRIDPSARLHTYTDYFGTEVIEFNLIEGHERLSIEARARVTNEQPPEPAGGPWEALDSEEYREAAGEFVLPAGDQPTGPAMDELARGHPPRHPGRDADRADRVHPGPVRVQEGRDLRGLDGGRPAGGRRRACARTSCTWG